MNFARLLHVFNEMHLNLPAFKLGALHLMENPSTMTSSGNYI